MLRHRNDNSRCAAEIHGDWRTNCGINESQYSRKWLIDAARASGAEVLPDLSDVLQYARLSSQTTHGVAEAVECCSVLAEIIANALSGMDSKSSVLSVAQDGLTSSAVISIAHADYLSKSRDQIQGSGYCVASLEAALWCFATTESVEAAILAAANLGDDADTTAAIAGQVAGAFYGVDNIPRHWREQLYMSEDIRRRCPGWSTS